MGTVLTLIDSELYVQKALTSLLYLEHALSDEAICCTVVRVEEYWCVSGDIVSEGLARK